MSRRWRVGVRGSSAAFQHLSHYLTDGMALTYRDSPGWRLEADIFEAVDDLDLVRADAERLFAQIRGVARLRLGVDVPLELDDSIYRRTGDGELEDHFVSLGATLTIESYLTASSTGGQPVPLASTLDLADAQTDERVSAALTLFGMPPAWRTLSMVLDLVREEVPERAIAKRGWATAAKVKRFNSTANSYRAVGTDARHGKLKWQPPKHPMTLHDARLLVGGILRAWLDDRRPAPATDGRP